MMMPVERFILWFRRLVAWSRERVRAFLGTDSLPTRLDIIQLRDDMAKYHREVMEVVSHGVAVHYVAPQIPELGQFQAPTLDWETMQKLELFKMMQNPPKED